MKKVNFLDFLKVPPTSYCSGILCKNPTTVANFFSSIKMRYMLDFQRYPLALIILTKGRISLF